MSKKDVVTNLKKSRSLLDKILMMVEEDRYCIDIMQQNLAVIGLLKSAHQILMENHLKSCFSKAIAGGREEEKKRMVEEILKVTKLSNK